MNDDDMEMMRKSVLGELDEAETFAKQSPPPPPASALEDVYA
jgi:hypothetical protein